MSALFQFDVGGNHYAVLLDASITETHSAMSQITEHQVEQGANINDHIRAMPARLSVTGIVTDTPLYSSIGQSALAPRADDGVYVGDYKGAKQSTSATNGSTTYTGGQAMQYEASFHRVQDIDQAFLAAQKAGSILTVTTSLRTYENVAIESYEVPRDSEWSHAIKFNMALRQLNFVSSQVVQSRAPSIAKTHKGSTATKVDSDAEAAQKKNTVAKNLFNSLAGSK